MSCRFFIKYILLLQTHRGHCLLNHTQLRSQGCWPRGPVEHHHCYCGCWDDVDPFICSSLVAYTYLHPSASLSSLSVSLVLFSLYFYSIASPLHISAWSFFFASSLDLFYFVSNTVCISDYRFSSLLLKVPLSLCELVVTFSFTCVFLSSNYVLPLFFTSLWFSLGHSTFPPFQSISFPFLSLLTVLFLQRTSLLLSWFLFLSVVDSSLFPTLFFVLSLAH